MTEDIAWQEREEREPLPSHLEILGQKINMLTVTQVGISRYCSPKQVQRRYYAVCVCECGNSTEVIHSNLRNGRTQSCGCIKGQGNKEKLTISPGDSYNHWTVIEEIEKKKNMRYFLCRCSCGKEKGVGLGNLRQGLSRSCGECQEHHNAREYCGTVFGLLTINERVFDSDELLWNCTCECGTTLTKSAAQIQQLQSIENTRRYPASCGCRRSRRVLIEEGTVIGQWTVVRELKRKKKGRRYIRCMCVCGTTRSVALRSLRYGTSTSCNTSRHRKWIRDQK